MLKRYRLYCAAIGGILIALATGLRAQDHREQQPQAAPAQQAQERTQPPLPITITTPVRVEREKEIEPDWDKLKCGEAKSHDEADLCEQRRMAKAAEDTVWLNRWQVIVGALGFAGLLWNLYYVRHSTKAAITAAAAANKAVAVAGEIAQRQLRAYLSCDMDDYTQANLRLTPDSCYVPMKARNRGQTPAYQFIHWVRMDVRPFPDAGRLQRDRRTPEDLPFPPTDIAPGEFVLIIGMTRTSLTPEEIAQLRAQTHRLYLHGQFYYRDAFKRRRYTRYCYSIPMSSDGRFTEIAAYHRYNKSN